jgi:hypothetical protein
MSQSVLARVQEVYARVSKEYDKNPTRILWLKLYTASKLVNNYYRYSTNY